jgi:hypothetical protein
MSTPSLHTASWDLRLGHLVFQIRLATDANLFGRTMYGLFWVWGVEGLPPLPNPPTTLREISRVPKGYGAAFGRSVYGAVMSKLKSDDMVSEVLSDFLLKVMSKDHELAAKLKGMPVKQAEAYIMVSVMHARVNQQRKNFRRKDKAGPEDISDTQIEHVMEDPDRGELKDLFPPDVMHSITKDIQSIFEKKNRPDIARDIPLYLQHMSNGIKDSDIIGRKMLPFLEEAPLNPKAWYQNYRPVVKKVFEKYRDKTASDATLDRVASLVEATDVTAKEFATPSALKDYLHDHPDADPKKHTVKKHDDGSSGGGGRAHVEVKDKGIGKDLADLKLPEGGAVPGVARLISEGKPVAYNLLDKARKVLHDQANKPGLDSGTAKKMRDLRDKLKKFSSETTLIRVASLVEATLPDAT